MATKASYLITLADGRSQVMNELDALYFARKLCQELGLQCFPYESFRRKGDFLLYGVEFHRLGGRIRSRP
ncbi:MAG: hypothetical protein AAFR61_03330 [Bacteroidota bacterium]